jgi:subtilase family serine protease
MSVGCAVVAAALVPVAGAHAALTRLGRQPATPVAANVERPVAAATRLHVTVTLKPRDPAALAAYAGAVSMPGSPDYHLYLTPAQFGRRFGATRSEVGAVRSSLRARGLRPGPVSAGALSIPVMATAAQLEHAFSISLRRLSLPGGRTAMAASAPPAVSTRVAPLIQAVVGLNTSSAPHPLLVRSGRAGTVVTGAGPPPRPHVVTGGPQPCASAQAAAPGQGADTADQIASAYGFSGLYAGGETGAGVTVAVYELEPDDPRDVAAYQACYGTHATISSIQVDQGSGTGAGSGEAALDIENLIGLAPNVTVLVYQGPNSNSGAPGSGPYDTFSAIINQDRARVVTVSWGQCEAAMGHANAAAENTLFEQAAAQGQSIVAASGDSGSEDCDTGGPLPQTETAVDDPSSQPFVTGVGGTTLETLGPRPTESVWNSVGAPPVGGMLQPGAGGGGISAFWPMPAAQSGAAANLGVRSSTAGGARCGKPSGFCREVPDVSADSDPSTGYLIYWNGSGTVPGQQTRWQGIGGTSGAAPLWAAVLALADGSSACGTSPVGYANPALYRAAGGAYAADFNDVTVGNNDFTGTNGGQYAAATGYDPASGLGTPNAASLAGSLCANTIRLPAMSPQRSTVHTSAFLRVHATDTSGAALTYRATGLPPGLRLDTATGRITGRASKTGDFKVRITARDQESATAGSAFTWTVGAAPRISHISLTQVGAGAPALAFTVAAGQNAPALQTFAVTVPDSLRLTSARRGVSVHSTARPPARLRFSDRISRTTMLTIMLRKATASVRISATTPTLEVRAGASGKATTRVVLSVTVTDSNAGKSRLTAKVAAPR